MVEKLLAITHLGGIGLVMLSAGFFIYPSTSEAPAPGYSQLVIISKAPVGLVQYGAIQISAVTAGNNGTC